jgi:hypothetical protein
VRLGRTLRDGRRLLRPCLRQGGQARDSGESQAASHIHTDPVDVLTGNLPNFAASRKQSCGGSPFAHAARKCRPIPAPQVRVLLAPHA